jgi:hypothetical protein
VRRAGRTAWLQKTVIGICGRREAGAAKHLLQSCRHRPIMHECSNRASARQAGKAHLRRGPCCAAAPALEPGPLPAPAATWRQTKLREGGRTWVRLRIKVACLHLFTQTWTGQAGLPAKQLARQPQLTTHPPTHLLRDVAPEGPNGRDVLGPVHEVEGHAVQQAGAACGTGGSTRAVQEVRHIRQTGKMSGNRGRRVGRTGAWSIGPEEECPAGGAAIGCPPGIATHPRCWAGRRAAGAGGSCSWRREPRAQSCRERSGLRGSKARRPAKGRGQGAGSGKLSLHCLPAVRLHAHCGTARFLGRACGRLSRHSVVSQAQDMLQGRMGCSSGAHLLC